MSAVREVVRRGRPRRDTPPRTQVVLHGDGLTDSRCEELVSRGFDLHTVGTVLRWGGAGRLEVGLPQGGWVRVFLDELTVYRPWSGSDWGSRCPRMGRPARSSRTEGDALTFGWCVARAWPGAKDKCSSRGVSTLIVTTPWSSQIDAWDTWLTAAARPSTTRGLRTYHLRRLAHAFPDDHPFDLTRDDLVLWLASHE